MNWLLAEIFVKVNKTICIVHALIPSKRLVHWLATWHSRQRSLSKSTKTKTIHFITLPFGLTIDMVFITLDFILFFLKEFLQIPHNTEEIFFKNNSKEGKLGKNKPKTSNMKKSKWFWTTGTEGPTQ